MAAAQPRIGGILAELLRSGRESYNARFLEARRYKAKIDPAIFSEILATTLSPIIEAVHACDAERAAASFDALYDLALELLGQELLGPRSRCPVIEEGWRTLLPAFAKHVAAEPRKVAGAISNALYNLAQTPDTRPDAWMKNLGALNAKIPDVTALLKAGQIAAWCAGMAHYRFDALDSIEQLSQTQPELACGLFGLPDSDRSNLARVIGAMKTNPWITPIQARDENPFADPKLTVVKRIGTFKGFGGVFLAPPCVCYVDRQFIVGDGVGTWVLSADIFGATLVKYATGKCVPQRHAAHGASGKLHLNVGTGTFPELKTVLSAADNGQTLVVSVPTSHALALLATVN